MNWHVKWTIESPILTRLGSTNQKEVSRGSFPSAVSHMKSLNNFPPSDLILLLSVFRKATKGSAKLKS